MIGECARASIIPPLPVVTVITPTRTDCACSSCELVARNLVNDGRARLPWSDDWPLCKNLENQAKLSSRLRPCNESLNEKPPLNEPTVFPPSAPRESLLATPHLQHLLLTILPERRPNDLSDHGADVASDGERELTEEPKPQSAESNTPSSSRSRRRLRWILVD